MTRRKKNSQSQSPILRMRERKRPIGRSKPGTRIQHCPSTFSSGSGVSSPAQCAATSTFSLIFLDDLLKPPPKEIFLHLKALGRGLEGSTANGSMFNYIGSGHYELSALTPLRDAHKFLKALVK